MNNKFIFTKLITLSLICGLGQSFAEAPANSSPLEPKTQKFIDSLKGAKPIYTLSPEEARKVLESVQESTKVQSPNVDSEDRTLAIGPNGKVKVRIIKPKGAKDKLPGVIYIHGAGWVMGDVNTHDRLVPDLAVGSNTVFVSVDYERSPEKKFPSAIEESYAVAKYVAEHGAEFGIDADHLAVAGDSVGGNMAAVVSLMAKERKGPKFAAQILFYPVTDGSMSSDSYSEFADGPWLTKKSMEWFWDAYLPDVDKRKDIFASPINATLDQLKDLPPALIIVNENDVLRDEGIDYGRKLGEAGVVVTSVQLSGTIHDSLLLSPIADAPAARVGTQLGVSYIKDHLHGENKDNS